MVLSEPGSSPQIGDVHPFRSRLSGDECGLPRRLELESIAAVGLIALKAMKQSITVVDRMLFVMFVDWFGEYAENDYEVHAPPPAAPRKLSELECDSNFCISASSFFVELAFWVKFELENGGVCECCSGGSLPQKMFSC